MRSVIKYGLLFDKSFAEKIEGAGRLDVMRLEDVAQTSLSSQHIEFLLTMGIKCNDLIASPDIRTNVYDIIDFYHENIRTGEEEIPYNHLLFGVGGGSIDHILINRATNGIFVIKNAISAGRQWSASLEKLLFRNVFARYRHLETKRSMVFVNSNFTSHDLGKCDATLEKFGLGKLWFSDTVSLSAESNNRALQIVKFEGSGWWVRVSAENELVISEIIESICNVFDIQLRNVK
ncbi:hypothetical protein [Dyadobacter alkalitolerans]|uniref:hypothetical protein n=1 Tax=Dyadobacter alkalitolerans TaxID=492736 RepID=UPI0003FDFA42|nr:hypothetical protein [Dyadobacter alkalitolerans]